MKEKKIKNKDKIVSRSGSTVFLDAGKGRTIRLKE